MNICIFSRGHISQLRGGVDRVTTTISTALENRGHNIFMISVCNPVENDKLAKNQFVLPYKDILCDKNKNFVIDFLRNNKIDIILNQSDVKAILDLIYNTHQNIPIVSYNHGDPKAIIKGVRDNWDEWKLKKGKKFWGLYPYWLLRMIYQYHNRKNYTKRKLLEYYEKSNALVFLSEKFKKSFIEVTGIKDCNKLHFISNPNTYQSVDSSNDIVKENIILFVGRLDLQKRVDRLLKVWKLVYKQHPDWKLQILGDGAERIFYENYSQKLKLKNIEFLGACDPKAYYQKAKIICLTSSHEGFGMTITEAMQYNVIPIVFHSYESVTDIIEDNVNGILVKPFSTKEFAKKLSKLIDTPKELEKFQQNIANSDIKEKFSIERISNQLENLFQKLIYASN